MHNAAVNVSTPSSAACDSRRPEFARQQRSHERALAIMRIAKLTTANGDDLGIVRNVSPHEMMIEVHPQLPLDGQITVDLGTGYPLQGTMRWRNGAAAGLHFPQAIDVEKLLGKSGFDELGRPTRQPRIAMRQRVDLACLNQRLTGEVRNISLSGARIALDSPVERGARVDVTIPLIGTAAGVVRWTAKGFCGVSFDRPISIHALMALRATCPAPQSR